MDSLDAALLRSWLRESTWDVLGIDPRKSVARLAADAGVTRTTARQRLDNWRETGFLGRIAVLPNPALFGGSFTGQYHMLPDASALPALKEELGRSARTCLVYEFGSFVGRELMFATLDYLPPGEIAAATPPFAPVSSLAIPITPRFPFEFPALTVTPDGVDWQLLRYARQQPVFDLEGLAGQLRISAKRCARRLGALLDGQAVYFVPLMDFPRSRGSVVVMAVFRAQSEGDGGLVASVRAKYPDVIVCHSRTEAQRMLPPSPDGVPLRFFGFVMPVRTGQMAAEVMVALKQLDGVREVLVSYPLGMQEPRNCFDQLLELAVPHHATSPRARSAAPEAPPLSPRITARRAPRSALRAAGRSSDGSRSSSPRSSRGPLGLR